MLAKLSYQRKRSEAHALEIRERRAMVRQVQVDRLREALSKWPMYRENRDKAAERFIALLKKQRRCLSLVVLVKQCSLLKTFRQVQVDYGIRKKAQERRALVSSYFNYVYRTRYCRKFGLDYKHRQVNYIRRVLTLLFGGVLNAHMGIYQADPRAQGGPKRLLKVRHVELEARKVVHSFLEKFYMRDEFTYKVRKRHSMVFLKEKFESIFVTRLLRKKYLYQRAATELEYLTAFYSGLDQKRGRGTAARLQELDQEMLKGYLDSFIDLKSWEFRISQLRFHIDEVKQKMQLIGLLQTKRVGVLDEARDNPSRAAEYRRTELRYEQSAGQLALERQRIQGLKSQIDDLQDRSIACREKLFRNTQLVDIDRTSLRGPSDNTRLRAGGPAEIKNAQLLDPQTYAPSEATSSSRSRTHTRSPREPKPGTAAAPARPSRFFLLPTKEELHRILIQVAYASR